MRVSCLTLRQDFSLQPLWTARKAICEADACRSSDDIHHRRRDLRATRVSPAVSAETNSTGDLLRSLNLRGVLFAPNLDRVLQAAPAERSLANEAVAEVNGHTFPFLLAPRAKILFVPGGNLGVHVLVLSSGD